MRYFFLISFYFFNLLAVHHCWAQDSLKIAIPDAGDGIYSLLRKNGFNATKYYNAFVKQNKELLDEGEFLKAGTPYKLPDTVALQKAKMVPVPKQTLFGTNYAVVDSLDNKLKGTIYYLVSGHGGPDPGALANYNDQLISEDEYAYDITLRLARELMSHGAEVVLIVQDKNDGIRDARVLELDTDEVVFPDKAIPLGQLDRLKQRTKAINELYRKNSGKYQRLIVTHIDSRSKGATIDVFFYYHEKSKNGKRLAESIHQTFAKKYARFQPNRGYTGTFGNRSELYLVKRTLPPMTYIEVGNIKNVRDQRRILDPDNRQALAKWISEGIILDYTQK